MTNDDTIRRGLKFVEWMREDTGAEAYIAGGAVRDWLLDAPIKDVDVWVLSKHGKVCDWLAAHGGNIYPSSSEGAKAVYETDPGARSYDIVVVCEGSLVGVQFNLIFVSGADSIEHVVSEFDFGICRAWMSELGNAKYTPEFSADRHARTLTLLHPHNAARIDARIARLTEKFPGYTVVR